MDKTNFEIGSPTRTRAIMERYGLTFKKSLGQNFLCDQNVLGKICDAAEVSPDDDVIEIGPGIGALTEQLAKRAHKVVALEIDQRLIPVLGEVLSDYANVVIENIDVLKANLTQIVAQHFDGNHAIKVVANLPYYITTPIVMHLLNSGVAFEKIVIMMQKEVANRICAQPDSKDYGSLSCAVQYQMQADVAFIVPKTVFMPQPKVDSAIVALTKRSQKAVQPRDEALFLFVIKAVFVHRRKSLKNNLQSAFGKDKAVKQRFMTALASAKIEPSVRAETLDLAQLCALADELAANGFEAK